MKKDGAARLAEQWQRLPKLSREYLAEMIRRHTTARERVAHRWGHRMKLAPQVMARGKEAEAHSWTLYRKVVKRNR